MGFSAGAELAAAATLQWADFDRKNDLPGNPLAKVSSRPDFAALIYPGPSPFTRGATPPIPRDAPPVFLTCAGWGDWGHAVWATEYFTALLNDGVPNVEMHIYARGHHPGDKVRPDEPPSTGGLTDRGFIAYGTWIERFDDWFRDLGFFGRPGVETQAAKDVAANLGRVKKTMNWGPPRAGAPVVPDWALPGSATHNQVPPPPGFHRPTTTAATPIGVFEGQSDIGTALVPASADFNAATGAYTIKSAGYNIWYNRDEFRYLWKKMDGDVSLAADVAFPNAGGYGDRKAVLVIRQDLDDDSEEVMTALHGAGLIHLAARPEKNLDIKENCRIEAKEYPTGDARAGLPPVRLGIEKHGDTFALYVSLKGEPMHQAGPPLNLHLDGPFYVGIGFCSHLPATTDTTVLTNVVLENAAGRVR
jgi:hypothetical protein